MLKYMLKCLLITLTAYSVIHLNNEARAIDQRCFYDSYLLHNDSELDTLFNSALKRIPKFLPKKVDANLYYTYCENSEVNALGGLMAGKCFGFSINHTGNVEYTLIDSFNETGGASAGLEIGSDAFHRIRGISTIDEISGKYLILTSDGAIPAANVRENWFVVKLTTKGLAGNWPEFDWGVLGFNSGTGMSGFGVKLNLISLGYLTYDRSCTSVPSKFYQFSKSDLNSFKYRN